MSAYICDERTIIDSAFALSSYHGPLGPHYDMRRAVDRMVHILREDPRIVPRYGEKNFFDLRDELAQHLYSLNINAVAARYVDNEDTQERCAAHERSVSRLEVSTRYTPVQEDKETPRSLSEILTSWEGLTGLLYQCDENAGSDHDKALKRIYEARNELCFQILRSQEEERGGTHLRLDMKSITT